MRFGEGWHNNHHAYPRSARHGLAWYELDISWWEIRFLQKVGLATAVRRARLQFKVKPTAKKRYELIFGPLSANS